MWSRFLTLLLATVVMASCVEAESPVESTRKVKSSVAQAVIDSNETETFPGKVHSAADVDLAFRVAGVVDRVARREGSAVREGDVIAYLDRRDYELQLRATEAEYDAISGEANRVIELYESESVSKNDYDKAVSGLKQITAKLEAHRNALADTELKAPCSGYVQQIYFERGATVAAGMPIVSFVSSATPEMVINIPIKNYIRRGDLVSAEARFELYPGVSFPLQLAGVAAKANLNQLHEARFKIGSVDGVTPTAGMVAMVDLHYSNDAVSGGASEVIIPMGAIVERDGKSYVWVINSGSVTLREVSVANIKRDGTAVVSGAIEAGDEVVSAGVRTLKEGVSVEPLKPISKSNVGGVL